MAEALVRYRPERRRVVAPFAQHGLRVHAPVRRCCSLIAAARLHERVARRADGGPRRVSELLLCVAQAASRADIPLHPSRRARHRAASLGSGAAPSRGRAAPSSATPNGRGRLRGRSSTAAAAGRPSSTRRDDDDVQGVSERAESSYAPLRGAETPGQHLHHRRGLQRCRRVVVAVAWWGNL